MNAWQAACAEAARINGLIVRLCDLELERMEHGENDDWRARWAELGENLYQSPVDENAPHPIE